MKCYYVVSSVAMLAAFVLKWISSRMPDSCPMSEWWSRSSTVSSSGIVEVMSSHRSESTRSMTMGLTTWLADMTLVVEGVVGVGAAAGAGAPATAGDGGVAVGAGGGGTITTSLGLTRTGSLKEPLTSIPVSTLLAWFSDTQHVSPRSRATYCLARRVNRDSCLGSHASSSW